MDVTTQLPAQTALENALKEVQAIRDQFQLAIDTIPGLVWSAMPDGHIDFFNQRWRQYTGLTVEQAGGWGWRVAIHPEDLPDLESYWRSLVASGKPGEKEARLRRVDEVYRWFLFRAVPLYDDAGTLVKWYGQTTDIDDRKQAEQRVRRSEAYLAEAQTLSRTGSFGWIVATGELFWSAEFAFEGGAFVTKSDSLIAGLSRWLPMDDSWPWPELLRAGKHCLMEDIRDVPSFPLRDRLVAMGVITVLMVPMLLAGRLEGAIAVRFRHRRAFRPEEIEFAKTLANQAVLAMQLARLSAQSRDSAVLAERNRMARDIHDTLAQGFTGVIVQLEAADDAMSRGLAQEGHEHLSRARDLARESLREARRSVQALRPQALEERNLCDALDTLFTKMTSGTNLRAEFILRGDPGPLPPEWEDNLLHIGQEVFTNALRHAWASRFTAQVVFTSETVRMDLSDDGRGFELTQKTDGVGLLGIRERVERMGGDVTIQSTGNGTAISITLSLADQPRASVS